VNLSNQGLGLLQSSSMDAKDGSPGGGGVGFVVGVRDGRER